MVEIQDKQGTFREIEKYASTDKGLYVFHTHGFEFVAHGEVSAALVLAMYNDGIPQVTVNDGGNK